jgi:hypothetical protein
MSYFVKGVKWPDNINNEGAPISWYCRSGYGNTLPVDGATLRDISLPCEFDNGRVTWKGGIPNTIPRITVYYSSTKGYFGWLCDSPIIYRVPDGGTVTFEGCSPRSCRNWQVEAPAGFSEFSILDYGKVS